MQEKKDKKYWKERRRFRRREKRSEKRKQFKEKVQGLTSCIKEKISEIRRKRKERIRQEQLEEERRKRQEKEAGGFWAVRRRRIRRFFIRKWRTLQKLIRADYRHWVAVGLLALSVLAAFTVCKLSSLRFWSALGDVGSSIKFYFLNMIGAEYAGEATVNIVPTVDLQQICPFSIADVLRKFELLGDAIFAKEMFLLYLSATARVCRNICLYVLMFGPVLICLVFVIRSIVLSPRTERKDTRPLLFWKEHVRPVFRSAFGWIKDLLSFIGDEGYEFWFILIWLFNLNIFTMAAEFIAWYFYFVAAFSFDTLGVNLFRWFIDVLITLWSAPWWFWAIVAWTLFDDFRRNIGYRVLRRHEALNAGYFASLPVVSLVVGTMGKGKTTCITDMGLTGQNYFRRKAQELMFDLDMKFPNFPYQRLEDAIDGAHRAGVIFNLASIKPFLIKKKRIYDAHPQPHRLFGYDVEKEAVTFNNDLSVSSLFSMMESYAKLYYLYTIESPLISANYSVRSDAILHDEGNYPLWDDDFFEQDVEDSEDREQYCHIIDMDTLRMGKLMDPENPRKGSKEFGVDLISEMGKERGNAVENKGMKKEAKECNPLNDGFNIRLKMHRHPAVIENFSFAKIIGDEQREESLGADARDLADVVKIRERSDLKIAMPFYALGNLIYALTYDRFRNFYYGELRFIRGDNSLFLYAVKNAFCTFYHYHTRIVNRFGYRELVLERQSGTGEGEIELCKYYLANKKIYSRRFKTDCYADLFAVQAAKAKCGLEDYPQYQGLQAKASEYPEQHSYFAENTLKQAKSENEENNEEA